MEQLKAVVALFTYRKLEFLNEILDEIKKYDPPKVYIFQNKYFNETEEKLVKEVEDFLNNYSFATEVEIISQEKHLKINDHFLLSLNYAFSKEKTLIILEDDTIPSSSFFLFCNMMLKKYENHPFVGCINGSNLNAVNQENRYFYSGLAAPFWGWATWKSKWDLYKNNDYYWLKNKEKISQAITPKNKVKVLKAMNQLSPNSLYITWDILWNWALMANGLKCILPGQNLVSNKGFYSKGSSTNYENSNFSNLNMYKIDSDMKMMKQFEKEVEVFEEKVIQFSLEMKTNQKPRIYDDFSENVL